MHVTATENTAHSRHSKSGMVYDYRYGETVRVIPQVGSYVVPDGGGLGQLLLPGDTEPIGEGWPGCDFRWPNPVPEWRTKHAKHPNGAPLAVHVFTIQGLPGLLTIQGLPT